MRRKGFKHSEETRRKMSLASKGRKKSLEHKIALRDAKLKNPVKYWEGKRRSELTIAKMSSAMKGRFVGAEHPNWISDRTKLKMGRIQAYDYRYRSWMRQVKNRDYWQCQIANDDCSGRVEAHHILAWRDHVELRYEIKNGITLCHFHHPRKRSEEERYAPAFQELVAAKLQ